MAKERQEVERDVHVRVKDGNLAICGEVAKRTKGDGYFGAVKFYHDANATCDVWTRSMLTFVSKDDVNAFTKAWPKIVKALLASGKLPKHTPDRKSKATVGTAEDL